MTFDVLPLRFYCTARAPFRLDANWLRGGFGKALRHLDRAAYDRFFEPRSTTGPSGLHDAPRPFVFRVKEQSLAAGEPFDFRLHLFDIGADRRLIASAFAELASIKRIEGCELLSLPLEARAEAARVRVTFLTPTELKSAATPDFAPLFARLRDRISTLRALYQGGPLAADFKAMGERAAAVKTIRREIERVEAERFSRRSGQHHSLGGFTGVVEYEGALGEFMPYLEIGRYTGVGRQTVWGKGEIHATLA